MNTEEMIKYIENNDWSGNILDDENFKYPDSITYSGQEYSNPRRSYLGCMYYYHNKFDLRYICVEIVHHEYGHEFWCCYEVFPIDKQSFSYTKPQA